MWHDLTKFRHFGKMFKKLANNWGVICKLLTSAGFEIGLWGYKVWTLTSRPLHRLPLKYFYDAPLVSFKCIGHGGPMTLPNFLWRNYVTMKVSRKDISAVPLDWWLLHWRRLSCKKNFRDDVVVLNWQENFFSCLKCNTSTRKNWFPFCVLNCMSMVDFCTQ